MNYLLDKVNGLTVVTQNTSEFSRVNGLALADWTFPKKVGCRELLDAHLHSFRGIF